MSDTLIVTNATDIEFVNEHREALDKIEDLAQQKRFWEKRKNGAIKNIDEIDVQLANSSLRVRRGLVRYKPALDGPLPAIIVDANQDRDTKDEITIRWNAAAVAHRG